MRRPPKIVNLNTFDSDLECTEVIKYKKTNPEVQREKTMEKALERKNILNEVATVKPKEKTVPPKEIIAKFEKEIN